MNIVYLLESVREPWGGVQTVLRDARALRARGHEVRLVSRSGPPDWTELEVPFLQDRALTLEEVEEADLLVGTYWTTVLPAVKSGKGKVVHFCQGFEDDPGLDPVYREALEAVYSMEETELVVVSPHLAEILERRYGRRSRVVPNAVDERVMHPGPERPPGRPLRVGLVGPAQFPIKGIAQGFGACALAAAAGLELVLVRVSHLSFVEAEFRAPFPVEHHYRVPYEAMGDLYRGLDLFLGLPQWENEGFYLPGLEALACGVPAILADVPCTRSYGGEDYALFVPPGDPKAAAAGLLYLGRKAEARRALREEGLRTASAFSREARLDLLESVFREILQGKDDGAGGTRAVGAQAGLSAPSPAAPPIPM